MMWRRFDAKLLSSRRIEAMAGNSSQAESFTAQTLVPITNVSLLFTDDSSSSLIC